MNEEQEIAVSQSDDWDDIDFSDAITDTDEAAQTENSQADAADSKPTENGDARAAADNSANAENTKPDADHSYKLKYMGQEREYSREEFERLASKGQDYDRIRQALESERAKESEHNRNKQLADFVTELASMQGKTPDELMLSTHAAILSRKNGISEQEAAATIRLEEREKNILQRENALKLAEERDRSAQLEQQRRRQEFVEFFRANPGVKADDIPNEVYQAVKSGIPIKYAYEAQKSKTENERLSKEIEELKNQLETEKQHSKNAARSTGSQQSTGKPSGGDIFDELWYDGD